MARTIATGLLSIESESLPIAEMDAPRFAIDFHRGELRLDGHTLSAAHERRLESLARQADHSTMYFQPLGVVPEYWADATSLLLEAILATESASAILTANSLDIQGLAGEDWVPQEALLRASLPDELDVSVNVAAADPHADVAALCARALSAYRPEDINFEESGTAFRDSAYGVLERLAALADACRDSTIVITGHTDSSGNPGWNQQLSLARAAAVANYLHELGVARQRLLVAGAGSASPVADNATRYGRSLNRRIGIDLRPGAPSGVSP